MNILLQSFKLPDDAAVGEDSADLLPPDELPPLLWCKWLFDEKRLFEGWWFKCDPRPAEGGINKDEGLILPPKLVIIGLGPPPLFINPGNLGRSRSISEKLRKVLLN